MSATPQIPDNWDQQVSVLAYAFDNARDKLREHQNTAAHPGAANMYESACQDFLVYLKETFGTNQAFADFLKQQAINKMIENGYSLEAREKNLEGDNWQFRLGGITSVASQARSFYEIYNDIIDGIALIKAFSHSGSGPKPRPFG